MLKNACLTGVCGHSESTFNVVMRHLQDLEQVPRQFTILYLRKKDQHQNLL